MSQAQQTKQLNELSRAASAYLRSAMHQPVDWHEWSEEAFALAAKLNKPILLDIGAVWCHWCHVMDRESYENEETAKIINEHYVAVKVDRDERPDVDTANRPQSLRSADRRLALTAFLTSTASRFATYFRQRTVMVARLLGCC
jgi:uncharacterized protein YyaL (SSP411 family)